MPVYLNAHKNEVLFVSIEHKPVLSMPEIPCRVVTGLMNRLIPWAP